MSVFLIFLAIAGIAAWIFANSSHITAELAGVATVLSLGMSLVYAPWQVKLLLLVALLVTTQPLLRPKIQEPASKPELEEPQQQKILQYRGVSYQPTTEGTDAVMPIGLRFRRDGHETRSGSSGAPAGGHRATPQAASPDPRLKYPGAALPARSPDKI